MRGELLEYVEDMATDWYETLQPNNEYETFINSMRASLLCEPKIKEAEFRLIKKEGFIASVLETATEFYDRKEEMLGSDFMARLEQVAVLQTIDDKWREHLRSMDDLKEGIHLRSYGQKDPLLEYKQEAFKLFVELIGEINKASVQFAFKFFPRMTSTEQQQRATTQASRSDAPELRKTSVSGGNFNYQHSTTTLPSFLTSASNSSPQSQYSKPAGTVIRRDQAEVVVRCIPCGSAKKI